MNTTTRSVWTAGLVLVAAAVLLPGPTRAAIINGSVDTSPPGTADLTAIGWLDWAYWTTGVSSGHSGLPTNQKSGGSMIDAVSPVGGGTLRGSTSTTWPATYFSYSDGTSPVSSSEPTRFTGLFNTQLDTLGAGASLSVELPTIDPYLVYLWVANYNSTGQLTATLSGAANYIDASGIHDTSMGGGKGMTLYTLLVTPDSAGDLLTLDYQMVAQTGSNSHVAIVAAAVAVPEPSSLLLALLGIGPLAWWVVRRRAAGCHC